MDPEPVIDRDEVVALLFRVNDIADVLEKMWELLEADGDEEEE